MCTYFDQVGSTYYFRRIVLLELHPFVMTTSGAARAEWKLSLRTKDREEAKRLIPGFTISTDREIDRARAGYLKADAPGVLQPPTDGWHDSGDIVTIDAADFVTIRGRAKRFAKIGGEMVSLPAVEGYAAKLWPGAEHAVVTRPDARKGEQLVLFTTEAGAVASDLQAWGRTNGIAELALPRDIRIVAALLVLGTGKLDYVTMGEVAAMQTPKPGLAE